MATWTIKSAAGEVGFTVTLRQGRDCFSQLIHIASPAGLVQLQAEGPNPPTQWPANPPIQSVSEDGALLATGMAGHSFWSMAISPIPTGGLLFDVACRIKTRPTWLGCTYNTITPVYPSGDHALELRFDNELVSRVRSVTGADYAPTSVCVGDGNFTICPDCDVAGLPATIRWAYEMVPGAPPGKIAVNDA